jgi:hypothetical protein
LIGDPVTDKPAVMQGVYVDCKFMAGFKVARISIDIPIEHSNEFLRLFGAPDRANPVHVAVARMDVEALNAPTVPEKAVEPVAVEKAARKRSSVAFLMCQDVEVQKWLGVMGSQRGTDDGYESANRILKATLAIKEKKNLDTDPEAAARFDALRTDFELRDMVR